MRDRHARTTSPRSLRARWATRTRLSILLGAVLLFLAGCGMPDDPTPSASSLDLVVTAGDSDTATRLDGATVRGEVTVRVDGGDGASSIDFDVSDAALIDAPSLVVSGLAHVANLNTLQLDDGYHTLTATVTASDGTTEVLSAHFFVANFTCDTPSELVVGSTPGFGWNSADIGDAAIAGDTEFCSDDSPVVVTASGSDVWSGEDGFHFTYQALEGDGALTVRVDGLQAADVWTKVGVMVREDLSPGARNAFALLTDANGALFQRRASVGGATSDTSSDGTLMQAVEASAPWWLRIERQGDVLIGSHSPDGKAWTELGRVTIDLPDSVLFGTAVASRNPDTTATASFSRLRLSRDDDVLAPIPSPDPEPTPDPEPDPDPDPQPLDPVPITGPTVSAGYVRSTADIANPERGWHGCCDPSDSQGDFTLVRYTVRLDDYRSSSIPASFLEGVSSELASARQHGQKVIVRFAYNHSREGLDAPLSRVLEHIDQVAPVLQENADIIAALHAGFIGAWGEWNRSSNDLLDLSDRTAIVSALLDALPETRMLQIRYPYYTRDIFPTPPSAATAFDGSDASRVGQLNDCFVSTSSDGGTYVSSADVSYSEAATRYTVMGGETCAIAGLNDRNDGDTAIAELERYHYDYLNHEFYTPVIDKWRDQGYYEEISRRLGYRYVLQGTVAQAESAPGGTFSLNVEIENEGFGKLYNPRPIDVVLRPVGGGAALTLRASNDAREVLPGPGETVVVPFTVQIPATAQPGAYQAFVALPDAAATLADDPRYSIRFANDGVWDATRGENDLGISVDIAD